jgi:hypothetical protein
VQGDVALLTFQRDTQGVALLNFWKGSVKSDVFEFEATPE